MVRFVGSVQDYHHYIGPRIRNVVNQAAAPARKSRNGICEHCGQRAELQSAHVHGRDRRMLIEAVLSSYMSSDGLVDVDVEAAEREIIHAHMPIDETFKFICAPCHRTYDAGTTVRRGRPASKAKSTAAGNTQNDEFKKLGRIKLWAERPLQDNHRIVRAFLELEQSGEVYRSVLQEYCERELGMSGFPSKYANMKTDLGNSYGKVFFDDGDVVQMWPEVRREVELYF